MLIPSSVRFTYCNSVINLWEKWFWRFISSQSYRDKFKKTEQKCHVVQRNFLKRLTVSFKSSRFLIVTTAKFNDHKNDCLYAICGTLMYWQTELPQISASQFSTRRAFWKFVKIILHKKVTLEFAVSTFRCGKPGSRQPSIDFWYRQYTSLMISPKPLKRMDYKWNHGVESTTQNPKKRARLYDCCWVACSDKTSKLTIQGSSTQPVRRLQ